MSRGSGIDSKGFELYNNVIREYCAPRKKKYIILDFGCGDGKLADALSNDEDFDVYGCDVDCRWPKQCETSKEWPNSRFYQIDLSPYRLPFPDESFDFVISSSVMEHVHNKDEVFTEIRRVLKNGGYAIHSFPSKYYLPTECHMGVPLINYILPYTPRWWFSLWALLGVRKKYGAPQSRDMQWRNVVTDNIDYCNYYLSYSSNRYYEQLCKSIYGNYDWPMSLYIKHAKGSVVARVSKRLPFKKITGYLIRQFRMTLLVTQKK